MAMNASTHHDMLMGFAWTEKRWGVVEMHHNAVAVCFAFAWFTISLSIGFASLFGCVTSSPHSRIQ